MNHVNVAVTAARLLEVRMVDVVSGRGRSVTLSSVRCPVRDRGTAVEACAECGHGGGIARDALARGEYLACRAPPPERRTGGSLAEGAAVAEVMRRTAVAVRAGVGCGVAADALRARGVRAAPVVDGDGRPVGAVTEADLLRARTGAKVADAMTKLALAVPENATLARAASLMAGQGVERLAVVSGDGVVVGVLGAMDVVAWLARDGAPLAPSDAPSAQPA